MDELFTLYVHHGGYFDVNPQKYVGGEVGVVDNCDLDKWSKVEIESICKEFGYTHVSRLWYRIPEDNEEDEVFQLIKDDHNAMAMTKLVRSHGQIHVYVEHPVYEPILINGGNGVPVDIVVGPGHDDPFVVSDSESCSITELECSFDGYYNGHGYYASSGDNFEDDDDSDDGNDHWVNFLLTGMVAVLLAVLVVGMVVGMVAGMVMSLAVVVQGMCERPCPRPVFIG